MLTNENATRKQRELETAKWLEKQTVRRDIIPAQVGFWLLTPSWEFDQPLDLSREPVIAWDIRCLRDGLTCVIPITPDGEGEYNPFLQAILYPNGSVSNSDVLCKTEADWLRHLITKRSARKESTHV